MSTNMFISIVSSFLLTDSTSPYEWKILEWDDKLQTKKTKIYLPTQRSRYIAEILSIWRKTAQKINQTQNMLVSIFAINLLYWMKFPKYKKIPQNNNNNNKEVEEPVDSRRYIKKPIYIHSFNLG